MNEAKSEIIVGKIVRQVDRVLIYPKGDNLAVRSDFHVIATKKDTKNLKIGDTVAYQPEGVNFGWFILKK